MAFRSVVVAAATLFLVSYWVAAANSATVQQKKPNIVAIWGDDIVRRYSPSRCAVERVSAAVRPPF